MQKHIILISKNRQIKIVILGIFTNYVILDIDLNNLIWGKELDLEKSYNSESSGIYSNSIQASLFVWDKSVCNYTIVKIKN